MAEYWTWKLKLQPTDVIAIGSLTLSLLRRSGFEKKKRLVHNLGSSGYGVGLESNQEYYIEVSYSYC